MNFDLPRSGSSYLFMRPQVEYKHITSPDSCVLRRPRDQMFSDASQVSVRCSAPSGAPFRRQAQQASKYEVLVGTRAPAPKY